MTKSAKQGTTKAAAEQAEPESAATETTDVAEAETEDSAKPAAEPATAGPVAESVTEDGEKPELDDVKRKFREALDRKKQFHSEGQGKGGHESGKVNGAHGPAASRRSFRRKSG
jgi:hypothetical protein